MGVKDSATAAVLGGQEGVAFERRGCRECVKDSSMATAWARQEGVAREC